MKTLRLRGLVLVMAALLPAAAFASPTVNTLGGAAAGAALGAIGGAIAGNAGTGAAAGAAIGGTVGVGKTIYDAGKPTTAFKGYVDACLREKGYEVVDWQ